MKRKLIKSRNRGKIESKPKTTIIYGDFANIIVKWISIDAIYNKSNQINNQTP